ncbi:hypothetical protein LO771_17350 [Streptacidiphilus sp. ASG 303]|uniref:hypothetical protein n=1 Tax=Streptacidiphilus sp. ASG 303 TaxID=2896847 RepID=UPI001E3D643D|nr:hypothetical protein [Streptacidiphilus sp. ASG 303]MCD0484111.1 hypothetical protein [Streptacidiphilus sp. ASG 303]
MARNAIRSRFTAAVLPAYIFLAVLAALLVPGAARWDRASSDLSGIQRQRQ